MVSGRYSLDRASDALAAVESRTALKAIITPNPGLTPREHPDSGLVRGADLGFQNQPS
jgi:hypothetical protein